VAKTSRIQSWINKGKATKARIKGRVSRKRKEKRPTSWIGEPTGYSAGFDFEFPVQV
jgi:hypothetical protein